MLLHKIDSSNNIIHILEMQVYYGWRKVTEEFVKRMDLKLHFITTQLQNADFMKD